MSPELEKILSRAVTQFCKDSCETPLNRKELEVVTSGIFARLIIITEQLGFHKVKDKGVAFTVLDSVLGKLLTLQLSAQETEKVALELLDAIYAEEE